MAGAPPTELSKVDEYILEKGCQRLTYGNTTVGFTSLEAWPQTQSLGGILWKTTSQILTPTFNDIDSYINQYPTFFLTPEHHEDAVPRMGSLRLFYTIKSDLELDDSNLRRLPYSEETLKHLMKRLRLPCSFPSHLASLKGVVPMVVEGSKRSGSPVLTVIR